MRHIWIGCISLTLLSCGDRYGGHPPYPTSGIILVNGEPAGGASVIFHHIDDWGEARSIVPMAIAGEDGRFVLSTYAQDDGAPAGEYRVTVEWPSFRLKKVGPDKLNGKYAKAETSGLTAVVNKGNNELPPFELSAVLVDPKKK
jgi:hypothetical protein